MVELSGYAGLFLVSLLAATIFPAQSESVLVGLLLLGKQSPWILVSVASVGNVLGAVINWVLGRYLETWRGSAWFPVSEDSLERAQSWYHRLGRWSLLVSWLPIIGDPLTLAAGIMREPFLSFLILVAIGKVARYVALAAVTLGWLA
jgi:membrane protein YqaA with SNARE-associated domain